MHADAELQGNEVSAETDKLTAFLGAVVVEDLHEGEPVLTEENGAQPIR